MIHTFLSNLTVADEFIFYFHFIFASVNPSEKIICRIKKVAEKFQDPSLKSQDARGKRQKGSRPNSKESTQNPPPEIKVEESHDTSRAVLADSYEDEDTPCGRRMPASAMSCVSQMIPSRADVTKLPLIAEWKFAVCFRMLEIY